MGRQFLGLLAAAMICVHGATAAAETEYERALQQRKVGVQGTTAAAETESPRAL